MQLSALDLDRAAERAYTAFVDSLEAPPPAIPRWSEVPDGLRRSWIAAAEAARSY
jgi:hypothetical protein